ncbi:MAG TPA: T9SS type A sorting domain-containing protein [Bacteroidia bacterium]|nr:T9SS type A sorting domain-containing protein [Bacteroidia bacterium]
MLWSITSKAQYNFNVNLNTGNDSLLDGGVNVIELSNGNFLACGSLMSIVTNYIGAYLVKSDAQGNMLWKKQFDFSLSGGDFFTDVKELPDKNYLCVGSTYDSTIQNSDVFLAKIDTNGSLVWFKKYTNINNDQSAELKITSDNKVIILGNSSPNPNTTYNDILLIKTDTTGNLIWRKTLGTIYEEVYLSLEVIKNNTEYLLGGRYGYYSSGNSYFDFGIVRTDTSGNLIWRNQYGTPSGDEPCGAAIYTLDSGFVMCGSYNNQAALMKIDRNGVQKWIKYFTLGNTPNDWLPSVKQLSDSSFVMIGSGEYGTTTAWTGFLLKADKNGNLIWKRHYDGEPTIPNYFYGFNTTQDGGFILTGQYNHIGQPYQNLWLVKTDSLGCDSVNCDFATDIKKIVTNEFVLFPNPSNGNFNLQFEDFKSSDIEVNISDIAGKIVYKNKLQLASSKINLDVNLENGAYFMEIKNRKSNEIVVKKVIVQK